MSFGSTQLAAFAKDQCRNAKGKFTKCPPAATAPHYSKGKPCGNSCIAKDKVGHKWRASMIQQQEGKPGAVQRAFELAKSGACAGVKDVRARLNAEGYSPRQIEGPSLLKQLRSLLREARAGIDTSSAD